MAGLAVAFGATSYVAGNHYLESQAEALTNARINELETNRPVVQEVELAKVVVASTELKFGSVIDESMLKVVDWPQDAFPEGAFTATSEVIEDGNRRALATIYPGEPILLSKVTGENGRAGLAGIIAEGKRAVTIPVDTVNGVAGFIQPGDFVDVLLTRQDDSDDAQTEIFMENVKILSVDQEAGGRTETAKVASSVTIETDTNGAQKIAWGLNVGSLSLTLRSAGDNAAVDGNEDGGLLSLEEEKPKTTSIKVTSGGNSVEVTVAIEANRKPQTQQQQQQ